ncbi:unnamed protein product, partial [Brugia timori]|uniref:Guanylate cyclase domain-containing protein n=1 Tax=Brugia timori TaxID=42155 RepID=A0A0R3RD33_9BILA
PFFIPSDDSSLASPVGADDITTRRRLVFTTLPTLSARSATLSSDVGKSRRRQKHDTFASTFPDGAYSILQFSALDMELHLKSRSIQSLKGILYILKEKK